MLRMSGSSSRTFKRNNFSQPLEHLVLGKLTRVDRKTYEGENVDRVERYGLLSYGFNSYINSALQAILTCKSVTRFFKEMNRQEAPQLLRLLKSISDNQIRHSNVRTDDLIYYLMDAEMSLIYTQQESTVFDMSQPHEASTFLLRLIGRHLCKFIYN
jgi:hypothetical protein